MYFSPTTTSLPIGLLLLFISYSTSALNMSFDKSKADDIPLPADRIRNEPESVWVEFIQLALDHKPLNLGQGFPDFAAPSYLIESLHNATTVKDPTQVLNNQYTRSFGHPKLVKALTSYYRQFRSFNELHEPNEQVLITVGAYEAIFVTIMAFVNPGDEVLIIDPAFDAYKPIVEMAQGKSIFIPLRNQREANISSGTDQLSSADFRLDMAEFERKISSRTRMLVLNSPNNPLGKMYSREELEQIAGLCIRHNLLVLADEVYEQMYYEPSTHLSIGLLPNMWQRTITIGSAGKTFSVTGWKIGWALGPKHLIRYAQLVHQTAIYTVATPLQEAIARALEHEMDVMRGSTGGVGNFSSSGGGALPLGMPTRTGDGYWAELRVDLRQKRDRMARILAKAGMRPVVPEGGYFMLADFSPLARHFPQYKQEGQVAGRANTNDYTFARWLSRTKKLQGIPASAFYSEANKPLAANLVRFCFIKQTATLDRLEALIERLSEESSGSQAAGSSSSSGLPQRSKL